MSARESRKSRSTPDLIPLLNRNPNPPLIFLRRRLLPRPSQVCLTWPHHVRRHALAATIFHFFASWIVASPRSSSASSSSMGEASPVPPPPDAGAAFVLESKGSWWHAGFHLTTAIVGPTILTLPYAFRGLGWGVGLAALTVVGAVTFYAYTLMSKVLDHCEKQGRRHIRFRELAADVLGSGWMFYFVVFFQTAINTGVSIGCVLLAGECLKVTPEMLLRGTIHWTHPGFREPSMPSRPSPSWLRSMEMEYFRKSRYSYMSAVSASNCLLLTHQAAPMQATMAPPATGKMVKGLMLCYSVIIVTFYSAAVSGYWTFGNKVNSNVLNSLLPDSGPSLAPTWLLGLAVVFVLLQLLAIGLVYSQVAYEIIEKNSADIKKSKFSKRNLVPRLILRTLYMAFCGFMAAMLPFFGDIVAVVGAIGFIPLDFVLPMLLYNISIGPSKRSAIHWINIFIMVVFTGVGIMGAFASIRKLVLDAHQFKLFSNDVVG
ncbi:probable GABA transporter 2 isoform X2 [Musa acuminata AAA Group]|uniref:probable GABA transporter 2 isoform X2 n=1 Tax=Musa acuminata AAA Group TaxID=214697 RepID=UPI0031DFA5FD